MNGLHDLGGMQGFGPIAPEPDEPVFHHDWERRVYALASALGPVSDWTLDADRHATESMPGDEYLSASYYEKWFTTLRRLIVETGMVTEREVATGQPDEPGRPADAILRADRVEEYVRARRSCERAASAPARYAVGERIAARNMHPHGHTRLPRYVRGRQGVIATVHGCHVFPDTNAHGEGEQPQWLYSVCFAAAELWGEPHPGQTDIFIDLWEPYLEPVPSSGSKGT